MAVHNDIGALGEDLAVDFLLSEGYSILHRNWRPEKGRQEVDVIASSGNSLIFVEVKTRTSSVFGEPEEYVSPDKMKNLFLAAKSYMQQMPNDACCTVRFDVVAILLSPVSHKMISYRHMTNAFQSDPYFY